LRRITTESFWNALCTVFLRVEFSEMRKWRSAMKKLRRSPSVWDQDPIDFEFPSLSADFRADVCIVGGGITGITAAYLLGLEGKKIVLLEADTLGSGTTGGTSAHLDPRSDTPLHQLIQKFGLEAAIKVIDSGTKAINLIEEITSENEIDCDFRRVSGYLFTEKRSDIKKLKEEKKAAERLGLNSTFIKNPQALFPQAKSALQFDVQAEFHPLKYLRCLTEECMKQDTHVFENSRVIDIIDIKDESDGNVCRVSTDRATIHAKEVILATHTPIGLMLSLQARVFPYRSYILGARLRSGTLKKGLYWDTETPYHYLRTVHDEKGELLIVGGADHKTGEMEDTETRYNQLREYLYNRFDVEKIDFHWSNQFYEPADGLPLIGKAPRSEHLYVATGFSGTGLTYGTSAAILLRDLIMKRENPWAELFSPNRVKHILTSKTFFRENLEVAEHFFIDRIKREKNHSFSEVGRGQGSIVSIEGKKLAVYKDESGKLYVLSPVCTHTKCYVKWNSAESSWDCPCHGGRFSAKGEVLTGPPTDHLRLLNAEDIPRRDRKRPPEDDEELYEAQKIQPDPY
jgi:glycine/D-amino acid oxidase-like deaminating enzyme/nitrite reductase/ring-hydroxylating ferredoxin subunit